MYNQQDVKRVAALLAPVAEAGVISDAASIVDTLQRGLGGEEPADGFMTKAEVIDFFQIKEPTYYDWLRRGWLKPYGRGRTVRFKKSEVITVRQKD